MRDTLRVFPIGGALFALDLTLWYNSLTFTSIANATMLVNTTSLRIGMGS